MLQEKQLQPIKFVEGCNNTPDNIRSNLRRNLQRNVPWLEPVPAHDKTLCIIGGGPSLKDWVYEISPDHDVLATNNSYSFLLEYGRAPDYWALLDSRQDNIEFIREATKGVKHLLAGQVHPDIYDKLLNDGQDVTLYLTTLPDTVEMVREIRPDVKEITQVAGVVGTIGVKAISLGFALGYRKFRLFGYDSSYAEGEHHAFKQTLNDNANTIEIVLEDKVYITTPSMAHQVQDFVQMTNDLVGVHGCEIELCCDGLLPHFVTHCQKQAETPLIERERAKYREIWDQKNYRKAAPGEKFTNQAIKELGMLPGDSVLDFGCGSGRGAQALRNAGMNVVGIDFADNCLDPDITIPFVECCLWELPKLGISADWGYCTDVMEHIPMEKVEAVLTGIRDKCKNGVFFNIATRPDDMGNLIGRRLHMTVMQGKTWETLLKNYWPSVVVSDDLGEITAVCRNTH